MSNTNEQPPGPKHPIESLKAFFELGREKQHSVFYGTQRWLREASEIAEAIQDLSNLHAIGLINQGLYEEDSDFTVRHFDGLAVGIEYLARLLGEKINDTAMALQIDHDPFWK